MVPRRRVIVAAALGCAGFPAMAQDAGPAGDPNLNDPQVERTIQDLEREAELGREISPAAPVRSPGVTQARAGLAGLIRGEQRRSGAVAEGMFLSGRRGRLIPVPGGAGGSQWVFLFDADAQGGREPPMVVLPNEALMMMERLRDSEGGDRHRFVVDGQVYSYRGRNYLLVGGRPVTLAPPADAAPTEEAPAPDGGGPPADPPDLPEPTAATDDGGEAGVDDLIRSLEAEARSRRSPLANAPRPTESGDGAPTTMSVAAGLMPEGSFVSSRHGRLTRGPMGEWVFVFDAGVSGEGSDPPMTLMPCANLVAIENMGERRGESLELLISGRVFVYKDRNQLLPTMFVVQAPQDIIIPAH